MKRRRYFEHVVLLLVAIAVGYQLFCEPIVGVADNRDYWRVTKQLGVRQQLEEPAFFFNIEREWLVVEPTHVDYMTSQVFLGHLAVAIDRVVSSRETFDLRMMGLVNALAYLAAVAAFLAGFRNRSRGARYFVGACAFVLFTDVRLVAYFNSFYCESAQLIFLVATFGFALQTMDTARTLKQRSRAYVGFLVAAVLFAFAKTQDLVFCFPLAAIAARILPTAKPRPYARIAIATAFVSMFVWGMKSDAYKATKDVNIVVTIHEEILPHSKNREATLRALDDPHSTFGSIARFYAKRPGRWWDLAKRRMTQAFSNTTYGNFEAPLRGSSEAFDEWSNWKYRYYPRSLWFWILAAAAYAGLLFANWRKRRDRDRVVFDAMWIVGAVLQFVAVATFEANGTEKHFFIFNVLVDLLIVMAILDVSAATMRWRSGGGRRRARVIREA